MTQDMVAPKGEEFILTDGTKISSLEQLYSAIGDMSDATFQHFVTREKHDFAAWIEHSLNDKFLAAYVRRAHTRGKLRKILFIRTYR